MSLYDGILVDSSFSKQRLIEQGVENPIEVVRVGVDVEAYPFSERNNKAFSFLYIYRGDREELDLVLSCYREVKKKSNCKLLIHSKKNLLLTKESGVSVLSFKPKNFIKALNAADCLIDLNQKHKFGLCLKKAMSTGIPAISLACGSMAEIVNQPFNYQLQFDIVGDRKIFSYKDLVRIMDKAIGDCGSKGFNKLASEFIKTNFSKEFLRADIMKSMRKL